MKKDRMWLDEDGWSLWRRADRTNIGLAWWDGSDSEMSWARERSVYNPRHAMHLWSFDALEFA